jgi:hypothetical protein
MTYDRLIQVLIQACKEAGGQRAWAARHGVSPAYVGDVIHGRRAPTDAVLKPLGLRRDVVYLPLDDATTG